MLLKLLVDPGEIALEDGFRLLLAACELGPPIQAIVADLLLDLVQSGDRIECLFGLRRLDILGIKDFTARVSPALRVCDSRPFCLVHIGVVAIALQDGAIRALQTQRGFDVLTRPTGVVQEADLVLLTHDGPEIRRLHLARASAPCLNRGFVHRDHARAPHRLQLGVKDRLDQRYRGRHQLGDPGTADINAGVLQFDVLAVQGLVVGKLVDDHAGDEADVGAATVQYANRSRRARQGLISAKLDDWRTNLRMT